MNQGKVFLLLLTTVLLTACSTAATTAPPKAPPAAAELPKCVITWEEARLGDAQPGAQLTAWTASQQQTERAAAAIANRFTTPATRGDAVYVVSDDGVMLQAVGIDETMPGATAVATTRGLRVGDPVGKVLELYGNPPTAGSHSVDYTDISSAAATLKLHVEFKTSWHGDTTVTAIEWVALTPPPDKPVCQ